MPPTPTERPGAAAAAAPTGAPKVGWLLVALAVWLIATAWLRPLLLPDEGRYAEVARAMLHADALVPRLDGLPFFHKPPLFYWLDIAAMRLVGSNVFAARFGSVVGGWLMGAALLLAMRRWHGARAATVALGVLATTPFFFIGAQYANHDMLVGGLVSAAVLAFARAVDVPDDRVDLRWLVAAWSLCALGVLAKGLIGLVFPALVIGPWLLVQRRWRPMLKLLHPLGLAAFAAIAAPWFVAMQLRYPGFYDYFFVEQHFRRFEQSNFNNVQGAWFFVVVMPLLTLPWSGWLPVAWRDAWRARDARSGLYLWWVVAVLGFFSIPSSKLVGYALPALAPWCALLGLAVARRPARTARAVTAGAAALCVALVVATAWVAPKSQRRIALELAQRIGPGDRVAMIDEYYYDVPFYARLKQPVLIFGRWDDPDLPRHDNWRKELFDAARFDPAAGRAVLLPVDRLAHLACGAGTTWFVVPEANAAPLAALAGAERVVARHRTELWRVPPRACR